MIYTEKVFVRSVKRKEQVMTTPMSPLIIQGGMGVDISSWPLARAVAITGQLGTISGVALERILSRILQAGDHGGHIRRALASFPFPHVAKEVLETYYVEGGKSKEMPFKAVPFVSVNPSRELISLIICANFAFVWLAKEGHKNPVSINYLTKLGMSHLFTITGAMLAGVDCITMGAGIPIQIPAVLDSLAANETAVYRVEVKGAKDPYEMSFNPEQFFGGTFPQLHRPWFVPIIASNVLGKFFGRLPEGSVQGIVIEEPTAGGHNAPPRKPPTYGEKDKVNYLALADLGIPFWIGGSYASPEKLKWARSVGAVGIQVGSIFALCEESNMNPQLRKKIRELGYAGKIEVRTDMRASPTTYPFKVVVLEGTLSEQSVYNSRKRICNQRGLATPFQKADGTISYMCLAESVDTLIAKGGSPEDAQGRICLCNGLFVTADSGDQGEPPVVTLGDDLRFLHHVMKDAHSSYTAEDAIRYLLSGV